MSAYSLRFVCRRTIAAAVVGFGIVFAAAPVHGDGWADAAAEFGKLPCRINGRIGTMNDAGRAVLLQIADRDVNYDEEGRKISAVEWYLGELAAQGEATGAKLLFVDNAKLLKLIGLKPRSAEGPLQHRYTYEEVEPATDKLIEAQSNPTGEDPEFETALNQFAAHFVSYRNLRESLQLPKLSTEEEILAAEGRAMELEGDLMPTFVPDKTSPLGWFSWPRAIVVEAMYRAAKKNDAESGAAFKHLKQIVAKRQQGDVAGFAAAVSDYAEYLKKTSPTAAFGYRLPDGWQELDVSIANFTTWYDDTLAQGAPIALFASRPADEANQIEVIYFPGEVAPVERIVNYWRQQLGWAPLTDAAVRKTLKPIRIGSVDGYAVELTEPEFLGRQPPYKILARILRRDNDALVVRSVGSPAEVEADRARFEAFADSFQVGSAAALQSWFALLPNEYKPSVEGYSIVLATVKKGNHTWQFRIGGYGAMPPETRRLTMEFLAKFEPAPFLAGGDPTSWTPPDGWLSSTEAGDDPVNFDLIESPESTRLLSATPMADYDASSELPLLNLWRAALELPLWKGPEVAAEVKVEKAGNAAVRIMEFIGPQRDPPPAPPPPAAPPAPPPTK